MSRNKWLETKRGIENINETKSCFFSQKVNKTKNPLAKLTKKIKRTQISKWNQRGDITSLPHSVILTNRIIIDYYKLYTTIVYSLYYKLL